MKLFLNPNDIFSLTSFSGNIDIDQIAPTVNIAQTTVIKRILGTELYNKIYTDLDTLSGNYLTLLDDYIVPMLAFHTVNIYLSLSVAKVTNAGAFKQGVENANVLSVTELNALGDSYKSIAISIEENMKEWLKTANISEYKTNVETTNLIPWH